MAALNRATLMGHLTADPELRHSPSGQKVASFTIAVNIRGRDGAEGHAEFFPCEIWGGWGENLCKTACKGSLVLVDGRLRQESWRDKESGQMRSRVKLRAFRSFHLEQQYSEAAPALEAGLAPNEEDHSPVSTP